MERVRIFAWTMEWIGSEGGGKKKPVVEIF
jgi:hypothetical protein